MERTAFNSALATGADLSRAQIFGIRNETSPNRRAVVSFDCAGHVVAGVVYLSGGSGLVLQDVQDSVTV